MAHQTLLQFVFKLAPNFRSSFGHLRSYSGYSISLRLLLPSVRRVCVGVRQKKIKHERFRWGRVVTLCTRQNCFLLVHFNFIFFSSTPFVNLISFSRFLTVLSQTLTPVSTHSFSCTFSILKLGNFEFFILTLWYYS